ncbi:MAG: aminotransferase class V-fold PLP-dependent enzyme [Candidatus Hydrothermarchaeota archaeon]
MKVEDVRNDIPILSKVIYLDNAATTPTPEPVIHSMLEFFREYSANVGRGAHHLTEEATMKYEEAREKIARFINAEKGEIVFTKNTTEAINLVANGLEWKEKDEVITTVIEHHSNLLPWQRLNKKNKIKLNVVNSRKDGMVDVGEIEREINDNTKLIAITHISNVFGSIQEVKEIGKLCKNEGILFLIDGAQSVGHIDVDVKEIGCDFYAISGHKGLLGPQGTGALYCRKSILEELEPLNLGGGTVHSVSLYDYKLIEVPQRFESGTPNIPGIIGLGRAIDYVSEIGVNKIEKREKKLTKQLTEELESTDKIELYCPVKEENRSGVISFNVGNLSPHDVAIMLDEVENIIVRSGHHCAMPSMELLGVDGTVRVSVHYYNTEEEINVFLDIVKKIAKSFS